MKKILIIDDDRDTAELFAYNLEKAGYRVVVGGSGLEAIWKVMDEDPPDCVLLDIMMPSPDGYEVCECLKTAPEYKDIPIIMISARGSQADISKGLNLGANIYLPKPFALQDLLEAVTTVTTTNQRLFPILC